MFSMQALLVELIDEGVQPAVLESMLFYFWFRCTAMRRNLYESFSRSWNETGAR